MQKNLILSQNILQTFIKQNRLSSTVAFLNFIKKQSGLKDFYDFFEKNNYSLPKHTLSKVLFHGSPQKQTVLVPHASIGRNGVAEKKAFIYATDDSNYAIFLALLNLKNGSASVNVTTKNTVLVVDLDFVNGPSKLKDGYVHVLSAGSFKKTKNKEYRTNQQVEVLFTIPVTPADLTVPICIQTES